MNRLIASTNIGRKNVIFGLTLFLLLGVMVGAPLTIDLLGGSLFTESQYQSLKVLHGYGVFLAFVNFFFGFLVDRMDLGRSQLQIASWMFIAAGLAGGLGRIALFLLSVPGPISNYAVSLIETLGFVLGTFIFVRSQVQRSPVKKIIKKEHYTTNPQSVDAKS